MPENKAPEVIWIDHECPEDGWSNNNEFCSPEYTAYISTTASDSALKAVGLCRISTLKKMNLNEVQDFIFSEEDQP